MNTKTNKLAMAVLALSLTHTANASDNTTQNETDHENTYWGVGIGSVLGAVIAGPPGAAIGATLGGSIGWGKDQNDALDVSLTELEQRELALQQHHQQLEQHRKSLTQSQHEIQSLRKTHAMQASRLADLEKTAAEKQDSVFLRKLAAQYAQDVYFQSGQAQTPEYAQARLHKLVELLKAHPDLQVTLKGYTDPFGSAKLNAALAQARVDGIRELLKTQGIDETRIIGLAIGEVKAVLPEIQDDAAAPISGSEELRVTAISTPKNHVLDRRVSIELSMATEDEMEDQSLASLAVLHQSNAGLASKIKPSNTEALVAEPSIDESTSATN